MPSEKAITNNTHSTRSLDTVGLSTTTNIYIYVELQCFAECWMRMFYQLGLTSSTCTRLVQAKLTDSSFRYKSLVLLVCFEINIRD